MENGLAARNWRGELRVLDEEAAASAVHLAMIAALLTAVVLLTTAWSLT